MSAHGGSAGAGDGSSNKEAARRSAASKPGQGGIGLRAPSTALLYGFTVTARDLGAWHGHRASLACAVSADIRCVAACACCVRCDATATSVLLFGGAAASVGTVVRSRQAARSRGARGLQAAVGIPGGRAWSSHKTLHQPAVRCQWRTYGPGSAAGSVRGLQLWAFRNQAMYRSHLHGLQVAPFCRWQVSWLSGLLLLSACLLHALPGACSYCNGVASVVHACPCAVH